MTDINILEDELKEEFEMFSIAISRSDVMDKRKIFPHPTWAALRSGVSRNTAPRAPQYRTEIHAWVLSKLNNQEALNTSNGAN